jgi:hypothetical protein
MKNFMIKMNLSLLPYERFIAFSMKNTPNTIEQMKKNIACAGHEEEYTGANSILGEAIGWT